MYLEHLQIHQFRSIPRISVRFDPGHTLIVGRNACGKTSLLEAVFYLVTGRSFRTRCDYDCVAWNRPQDTQAAIRGKIRRAGGDTCRLAVTLGAGLKSVRVDDQSLAQLGELWGMLHAVLFTPDDLQLIKGAPRERRRYIDVALSQIDHAFLFHLQRYSQALCQRNALLKQSRNVAHSLREQIAPWDEQLIEHGLPVFQKRYEFLDALEPRAAMLYAKIVGEKESAEVLTVTYSNFLKTKESLALDDAGKRFRRILHDSLEEDVRRGSTGTGPHRDDFVVSLDGKVSRDFASQGQVRSCVLALRLAEVIEMEVRTGDPPILLLDDLASELDADRKKRVLELLQPHWQTFMTTTHREDFPAESNFANVIDLPGLIALGENEGGENHGA